MKKLFFLFLLIGNLCFAQTNEQADASNTFATAYVYRPGNYTGALSGFDIHITYADGTEEVLGRVKNNNKFEAKLTKEGKAEIWAKTEKKASVTVNVKFGERYYIKAGIKMGVMLNRPELTLVFPDQGETDYASMGKKKEKK